MLFKKTRFHPGEGDYRRLVADLVLKTYKRVGYGAINVGEYDLTMGVSYLKSWQKRLNLPLISANLTDKNGRLVFKPDRMLTVGKTRVGIVGVMKKKIRLSRVPDGQNYRVQDPYVAAKKAANMLRKRGAAFVILLTDMTSMGCLKIAHMQMPVNLIIGSSRRNRLSLPRVAFNHLILHLDRYGKYMGKFVLFCSSEGTNPLKGKAKTLDKDAFRNVFIALKKSLPKDHKIAEWMETYLNKIYLLKTQLALSSGGNGRKFNTFSKNSKVYVGALVCKRCHLNSYKRWFKTGHKKAYMSLVKKRNQFDEDCIGCHSVGFRKKGGFKKITKGTMKFVNVQCEACHGPGSLHVNKAGNPAFIVKNSPRSTCIKCHTEEHSPDFIYKVYMTRLSCKARITKVNALKNHNKFMKKN